jgi:signal transduction histidine kinase
MDSAARPASLSEADAVENNEQPIAKAARREPWWALPGAILFVLFTLVLDLIMPKGASPDIGYCAAMLMAAATRQVRVLMAFAAACLGLTVLGYTLESHGDTRWMDIFDRATVSGVIVLTAFLGWRRMRISMAMQQQAEVLQATSRQLARSNADLERFATVVSHDLRSPLTALKLNLELLARQLPPHDDESAESILEMRRSIEDMSSLIASLLEHGRASHEKLEPCNCDMQDLLQTVLKRLAASLQGSGAQVTHDPLPVIRCDQTQFLSLFQNLIENAIKYRSAEAPRIHISAAQNARFTTFSVRDNGIGIDPHHQQRIFQMFERATSSRGGAGVGLAVCKSIVERHGGKIWVESWPGRGSTFSFTIPNSSPPRSNPPRDLDSEALSIDAESVAL